MTHMTITLRATGGLLWKVGPAFNLFSTSSLSLLVGTMGRLGYRWISVCIEILDVRFDDHSRVRCLPSQAIDDPG